MHLVCGSRKSADNIVCFERGDAIHIIPIQRQVVPFMHLWCVLGGRVAMDQTHRLCRVGNLPVSSFQYSVFGGKGVREETTQKVDVVLPAYESNVCVAKVNDHHKVKTLGYTLSCFTKSN